MIKNKDDNQQLCISLQEMPVKYHAKALSTFHQINAFEQDGFLMLDICCSDDGQAINNFLVQNLRQSGEALDAVMFFLKVIVHPKRKIASIITHPHVVPNP